MQTLVAIADALYALPLGEFVAARDERARDLRGSDPELSRRVKALTKPTVAAWVVNQLARLEPDQVEQVLGVGEALREAQQQMSAEELRALTRQRRQLTAAVTQHARGLARERGVRVTEPVADRIEATLTAAVLDPGCARAVRSGMLVTALRSTGVEHSDVAAALAVPDALGFTASAAGAAALGPVATATEERGGEPSLRVVADPQAEGRARRDAEAQLSEAEEALAAAGREHDAADAEVERLEARSLQLQAEIDELRRRLADLETASEDADDDLAAAEEARAGTAHALADATEARDEARTALERLPPR